MKLSTDELSLIVEIIDDYNMSLENPEVEELRNKFWDKYLEVTGQKSRLASNSDLKNMGI